MTCFGRKSYRIGWGLKIPRAGLSKVILDVISLLFVSVLFRMRLDWPKSGWMENETYLFHSKPVQKEVIINLLALCGYPVVH